MLWLLVVAAASSEHLHGLLHPDAHQSSHDCVVTQLASGQVDTVSGTLPVGLPPSLAWLGNPVPALTAPPAPEGDSCSARGPPWGRLLLR